MLDCIWSVCTCCCADSGTKILLDHIKEVIGELESRFEEVGAEFSKFEPDANSTLDQSGVASLLYFLVPDLSSVSIKGREQVFYKCIPHCHFFTTLLMDGLMGRLVEGLQHSVVWNIAAVGGVNHAVGALGRNRSR